MTTIKQVQNAVKKAPHYRVTCGALEVIGSPGATRWTFDYIVRRPLDGGKVRTSLGKQNAVNYLYELTDDMPVKNVTFQRSTAETREQLAKRLIGEVVREERARRDMIEANRARSQYLRDRAWSENALDVRAFHAFALTCDKDGNRAVESAADYTQTTIILWRAYGASPSTRTARAVFRDSYALARQGRLVETVRLNRG